MATGSTKAVYAALFGNLGIAVTKFIAAAFTGSASMSEVENVPLSHTLQIIIQFLVY